MKTKSILLSLLALTSGICALAQENDDMYFTSRDRSKVSLAAKEEAVIAAADDKNSIQTLSPSESYSARNENPDYVAGVRVGSNANTTAAYFVPNYQPAVNQSLYANNTSYNNYYNNNSYNTWGYPSPYSMYSSTGYGMYGMSGMGWGYNPYSMYGSYGMGMGYGMGYGYGFGLGYGSMYGMYGYPYYGYGMGYGYSPYSYGYGYTTVAGGYETGSGTVYGRRPTRGTSTGQYHSLTSTTPGRTTRGNSAYYSGNHPSTNARTSSHSLASSYYNTAWRQNSTSSTTSRRSTWSNTSTSSRPSFWNTSNSGTRQSSWGNSNPNASWGRSSTGFGGGGGGSRSGGFSTGGGGGFSGGGGGGHSGGGGGGHGRR